MRDYRLAVAPTVCELIRSINSFGFGIFHFSFFSLELLDLLMKTSYGTHHRTIREKKRIQDFED
jgi:hypothetical protein